MFKKLFVGVVMLLVLFITVACEQNPYAVTPAPAAPSATSAPAPATAAVPATPATAAPTSVPAAPTAPATPAAKAASFYEKEFLWKNGAAHSDLPTGPNGSDVSWLVHGDIGFDHTCHWKLLSNTSEITSLYPGTFRVVGIRGGTYDDRLAVAKDRMVNYGQACTQN